MKSLKDVSYIQLIDGVDILIFCLLNLFIPNRGVLKSSTITMESSVYPSSSNSFCFMNFDVLLLYTYLLRIILPHFHALEKEMVIHSSVLAWRIPGIGDPGGLPSMGSHRVGHD